MVELLRHFVDKRFVKFASFVKVIIGIFIRILVKMIMS